MKKWLIFGILVACGLFYNSCDNELELIAEWKDIPVVYGLINRNDTAHFVRVEKAFIDPKISALELAQIPDSLYYENVQVQIMNTTTNEIFNLTRVDGNTEGFPRKEGVFASSPNYLYKLKLPDAKKFGNGDELQLILNRGDNTELVTATAAVVSDFSIASPDINNNPNLRLTRNFPVSWRHESNTLIFDFSMIIYYEEKKIEESEWAQKSLVWTLGENIEPDGSGRASQNVPGGDFYRFLANNIEVIPGMIRRFKSISIQVDGGGADLKKYLDQGKVNIGITSAQVIPTYTNLSEGYGVFSSRNSLVVEGYGLEPASRDSLRTGSITAPLLFQ